ncbi:MAG: hypothetical protein SOW03_02175 [Campylobacter sp.]|nr:hypothetical protein [Campylobacteraceae bacterium]MDY2635127.1 hypothetical protein [Campylobacter sp.]
MLGSCAHLADGAAAAPKSAKKTSQQKDFFIFYLFCRIFGEFIIKNFKAILEFFFSSL